MRVNFAGFTKMSGELTHSSPDALNARYLALPDAMYIDRLPNRIIEIRKTSETRVSPSKVFLKLESHFSLNRIPQKFDIHRSERLLR